MLVLIFSSLTPGPNATQAETVGGGFPGWGTRLPELWRSSNKTYVDSFQNYWKAMSECC